MYGARSGFGLLELIVAIAIIGVMAAVLIPRLRMRGGQDIDVLVERISALTSMASERAIMTGKIYRVLFSFKEPAHVELQVAQEEKPEETERKFTRAESDYEQVSFDWGEQFVVKSFYIKGFDEAAKGNLKEAWLYVLPNGMSQEIIINIVDEKNKDERGLILNPFNAQLTIYDTFQKP